MVSHMFKVGKGVPQSYVSAHMWFNLSLATYSGNVDLTFERDEVSKLMTPAQIAEAQRHARVCFNSIYQDCD